MLYQCFAQNSPKGYFESSIVNAETCLPQAASVRVHKLQSNYWTFIDTDSVLIKDVKKEKVPKNIWNY